KTRGGLRPGPDAIEMLRQFYATPGYVMRTRYDRIISTFESEFSPHEIHYGFYETLFNVEEIQRLLKFLGLQMSRRPAFDRSINPSARRMAIPETLGREIRTFYGEVYDFCRDRFGAEFISRIWPSFEPLDACSSRHSPRRRN